MNLKPIISATTTLFAAVALAFIPAVTIKASAPGKAAAGKQITVSVTIYIPHGYHIYGPTNVETGIPTEVSVIAPTGFKVARPAYPPTKTFKALGETVPVFEGETTVKVTVTAPKGVHGKQSFTVKVSSQACNDRACLFPSTAQAKFTVVFR